MAEQIPEMQVEQSKTVSVVVRFYRGISSQPDEWRGQMEPVQSTEKRVFHGAQQLLQILQSLAAQKSEREETHPKEGLR